MSNLTKTHAEKIAQKLEAVYKDGRDHLLAIIYVDNKYIAQFGIRRGSRRDQGHNYIPNQIYFPASKCLQLAECTLNRPDWVKALQDRGLIEKPKKLSPQKEPARAVRRPARKK